MGRDFGLVKLCSQIGEIILHHRWWVIGLSTLFMLLMTAGVRFITVTNDYRILFGEDNPQLIAFESLENTYSTSNRALIAIEPKGGLVFTPEALGAIEELTKAAWQAPYSSRVDSLTNYSHSEGDGDQLIVRPLVEEATSLSSEDLVRVRKIALNATEVVGRLVSPDGRVGGMTIYFVLPDHPDQAVAEITDYLKNLLTQARQKYPDLNYYLTGDVVMNRMMAKTTQDDIERLMPIVLLVIVVMISILLRSFFGTLSIVLMLIFTINTTMGFVGWMGTTLNPISSGIPIIVMAIAVADSIHIVTATLLGIGKGLEKKEAVTEALRVNITPIFLTSLTTIIGFLSLNSSDSPPFHTLGNMVAMGVLCAFFYSTTLLPALLCLFPLRGIVNHRKEGFSFFDRLGSFVIARRTVVFCFISLTTLVLVMGIPRNELTDNWTEYFDDRYEFRRDTDFVLDNLTGLDTLEYSLSSGLEGGITQPNYLNKVESFAKWYREQPEVTHVQAFSDIMKRLNKNMHGDDPSFYRLPRDSELAAQYLLLYELSLPFGSDLNDRMDVAKSSTRMTVVVGNLSARKLRDLDKRAQAWLKAHVPELLGEASGISVIFAHLTQRNIESMLRGTVIAMALISFILIGVFKSIFMGLISFLPNFIPAAMSFGLWGYLVGRVGLASSVVTIIAFGIIVDDTIHFLIKYLKARRQGLSTPEAIRSTFRSVGRALWTTTVVLASGFFVFMGSGFELSWSLGILVSITLIFALIADFLLLPTLLLFMDRRKL